MALLDVSRNDFQMGGAVTEIKWSPSRAIWPKAQQWSPILWPSARHQPVYIAQHTCLVSNLRWYQIMLFGDRGKCVWKTCPVLYLTVVSDLQMQVELPNHYATEHPYLNLNFKLIYIVP